MNGQRINKPSLSPFKRKHPYTVIVEGNIGSGKTTFLDYFKQFEDVNVLAEPVEKWRDCSGHNMLEKLYADQRKWCFPFQSYVQLTMLQHHVLRSHHSIKLMERSIYSARYCFVEQMAKSNLIDGCSVAVMDEWFKWARANCDLAVDLIVYLRTSPEVAYERAIKRNRPEEHSVPVEYFKEIHKIHENWLYHKTIFSCPAPVLVINADLDESVIDKEYLKFLICPDVSNGTVCVDYQATKKSNKIRDPAISYTCAVMSNLPLFSCLFIAT